MHPRYSVPSTIITWKPKIRWRDVDFDEQTILRPWDKSETPVSKDPRASDSRAIGRSAIHQPMIHSPLLDLCIVVILEKRTDSRGRVTLNREYANKEVQPAVVEVDGEE